MQQCWTDATQYWDWGEIGSSQEENIQPHQGDTEIDKDLAMYGCAQLPDGNDTQ